MRQSSVQREGADERVPHPRELGWDDSLYESDGTGAADTEGSGPTDRGDGPDAAPDTALSSTAQAGGAAPADAEESEAEAQGKGKGGRGRTANGASARRRSRRGPWRILRWIAGVLVLLLLGTAGAGYLYYRHLNANIRSGDRSNGSTGVKKPDANGAGQTPLNILLIGSDSRATAENVKLGGSKDTAGNPPLGDVQMLVHVSADRKNASVVSIPRDTRVDIPECKDATTGKVWPKTNAIINESLARGGAGCTLSTWEKLTGVYIDHWMTIDFSGVVSMADAIGGVEVCVQNNVWDRPLPGVPGGSGLKLTAGTHQIQGKQALQWLRTRHAFESDLGRAKAQHMYMNAMIRELKSQNVFTDTMRLTGLAEAATKSLEVSEEIGTVKKLYDLAMQLKSVPTNRLTMTTMPSVEDPLDRNHLIPLEPDADKVWEMLREDVAFDSNGGPADAKKTTEPAEPVSKDPAAPPAETGVIVRNGTGSEQQSAVPRRAADIAARLNAKGYTLAEADSTPSPQERTSVTFPSADLEGDAQAVAKSLGIPLSSVKRSTDVSGVTLVVGADWREGASYPKASKPVAGGIPKSADPLNGSEKDKCMPVYAPYRF
ncbi:LCP family protein [Streptomyces sp. GMY02]|uniref:LCP family protein n=1 Tax=Streptomyces sp. GMY02 TaxID=1333528 RepID=UPI001C2C7E30|nr:LCP family protein [Streptomyces sp. GMY02]QXE36555.1 LCP family protein [Streptomyces sp. GMY02]